jgi:CDGSH-type Zn-finger protein
VFEVDLGMALRVTCVRCGATRELPEADGSSKRPALCSDGSTTLQADTLCRCGASRVRVELALGD